MITRVPNRSQKVRSGKGSTLLTLKTELRKAGNQQKLEKLRKPNPIDPILDL